MASKGKSRVSVMGKFLGKPNLNSYPNAGKKGMKLFSDAEISHGVGYERLYRIFWNKKAEEVCANDELRKWSKTAIQGVISTEWILKKTSLLASHAQKVIVEAYPKGHSKKQKKGTVKKGMLAMLETHRTLMKLSERLLEVKDPKNTERGKIQKVVVTEEKMKGTHGELKKKQESLRKALEAMSTEKGLTNTEVVGSLEVSSTTQLDSTEIQRLINAIMPERQQGADEDEVKERENEEESEEDKERENGVYDEYQFKEEEEVNDEFKEEPEEYEYSNEEQVPAKRPKMH